MSQLRLKRLFKIWSLAFGGLFEFVGSAFPVVDLPLGNPIVRSYSPREYRAHVENHCLARNSKGVLFVANGQGLLAYDGTRWSKIAKELFTEVFSVAVDQNDRIYVGSFNDFGYLEMASDGSFSFTSFVPFLPEDLRGDQMFGNIIVGKDRVVFSTTQRIYIWNTKSKELIVEDGLDNHSDCFELKGRIYSTSSEYPLRLLLDGKWQRIPGAELFSSENGKIQEMTLSSDERTFLVTGMMGIYTFDGKNFELFSADPEYVSEWRSVDSVLQLPSGELVVGTRRFGIYVFGNDGRIKQHITRESGLSDDWASSLIADDYGGVWMVQHKGISRIQLASPITVYNAEHGLDGAVNFIEEYEGKLLVGTSVGLYRGETKRGKARFELVEGVQECKSLLPTKHGVLVGTIEGLYLYKDGKVNLVFDGLDSSYLYRTRVNEDLIVVAGFPGLSLLRETEMGWERIENRSFLNKPVHGLAEQSDGSIWLKSGHAVARRIRIVEDSVFVDEFGLEDGLPAGWVSPLSVEGRVVFTSPDGRLYYFDDTSGRFELEKRYTYFPAQGAPGFVELVGDDEGMVWASIGVGSGNLVRKPDGDYLLGMQYLSEMIDVRASALFVDDDGVVWLGSFDGLTRYDGKEPGPEYSGFETIIRSVESLDESKTAYFEGVAFREENLVFKPGCNSVRVNLSTSWPVDPDGVLYRIYLEGFDREMPEFGKSSVREIVNLAPGKYVLKARSMDSLGRLGTHKQLAIEIVAPWHKSMLAYSAYVLLLVAGVYLLFRYRTRMLNRANQQLRDLVDQRTGELAKQSLALEDRNMELERRNVELHDLANRATEAASAKARFLAVVSHEIRTPMNGVMGMCFLLKKTGLTDEQVDFLKSIESSSDSLLDIIDDILDYSKIEEGLLTLESIEFDLLELLEEVVIMLSPQANDKALEVHLRIDPSVQRMRIGDPTRVRQVIVNLVGNAMKYTERGSVEIWVYPGPGDSEFIIDVVDTGIGIMESKIETIFEPFFQADVSNVRKYGGTGLGLSICKQIVDMMKGTVSVSSEQGVGSCFKVCLPLPSLDTSKALWDCSFARGKRIAICCTDSGTRESLVSYLKSWDVEIVELDAANLFMNTGSFTADCDLVILEHKLVSFDGMELARRVMEEDDDRLVPVVLLVSQLNDRLREEQERIDRLYLLAKPLIPSRLLDSIGLALKRADHVNSFSFNPEFSKPSDFSDLSVLVAEDNELNQDIVLRLLQSLKAKVKVVQNGEEAAKEYFENEYDLVLMDIQMPIASGIEATRTIFENKGKGRMPFVYGLSAGVMREERLRCAEAGMVGFIRKPFDFEDLVDALRAARDQRSRRKVV